MASYKILIHQAAYQKIDNYRKALSAEGITAGAYMKRVLAGKDLSQLDIAELIEYLLRTKQPQIFAERAVFGDGSDWSQTELSILGDILITAPVIVYDNGKHTNPKVHPDPFDATLIFVPGALLRNEIGLLPADWEEVTRDGQIDSEGYYALYDRRLLPGFLYANSVAASQGRKALITIPGLGCGQFAGRFKGHLGVELQGVLIRLLKTHAGDLPHIRAVYYDPYQECQNERFEIEHISLFVRPLTQGNAGKPQLCPSQAYQDPGDDFSDCGLFSFVAWDHVSWPGNDFYMGSRATDDGVKAAATSSMAVMTGMEGKYNPRTNTYDPPRGYRNWGELVQKERTQIQVSGNLIKLPEFPMDAVENFETP